MKAKECVYCGNDPNIRGMKCYIYKEYTDSYLIRVSDIILGDIEFLTKKSNVQLL